jgi:hypothetical protein
VKPKTLSMHMHAQLKGGQGLKYNVKSLQFFVQLIYVFPWYKFTQQLFRKVLLSSLLVTAAFKHRFSIPWRQVPFIGSSVAPLVFPTRIQQLSFSNTRIASVKTEVCSVVFSQSALKYKLCMYVPLHSLPKFCSHNELSRQYSRPNPRRTFLMSDTNVTRVHVSHETSTR